jgi:hypothetical protein
VGGCFQIPWHRHLKVVGCQPYAPAVFTARSLSRPQAHGIFGCHGKKSLVKSPGINPGTLRLVAECLNHYATPSLTCVLWFNENIRRSNVLWTRLLTKGVFLTQRSAKCGNRMLTNRVGCENGRRVAGTVRSAMVQRTAPRRCCYLLAGAFA